MLKTRLSSPVLSITCLLGAVLAGAAMITCTGVQTKTDTPPASSSQASPQGSAVADGASFAVTVQIDTRVLYPSASWLPDAYDPDYTDLAKTIKHFTEQSMQRDGIQGTAVVERITQNVTIIGLTSTNPAVVNYGKMMPLWFSPVTARQALAGVTNCQQTAGCWCTSPEGCYSGTNPQPWAMFLPLGLAMVNQRGLLFLDYPPASSLTIQNADGSHGDYLNNFTMCRWHNVLANSGATAPLLYETIVDSRPIAAAGSKLTQQLPDAITYFNSPGNYYLTPMVNLLSNPPSNPSATNNLSVAVLGSPARAAWQKMINSSTSIPVLGTSTSSLDGGRPTSWIGGNHPDVTTYQCCPNDPSSSCSGTKTTNQCVNSGGLGYDLIACETVDFTVACFQQAMFANPAARAQDIEQQCFQQWTYPIASPNQAQAFCIQAKLDNQNPQARCASYAAAQSYCQSHNNNPCATFDCGGSTNGYPCSQMPQNLERISLGSGKRLSPRPPPHLRGEGETAAEIDGNFPLSPAPPPRPRRRRGGRGVRRALRNPLL